MNKKVIISFIFTCLILSNLLKSDVYSSDRKNIIDSSSSIDFRVVKLRNYLLQHDSPLYEYAEFMIKQADLYDMDWRLLPAITGTESSFGKYIPLNSYNAYGWDNGTYKFTNWYDSISHVTKSLYKGYMAKGANSVDSIAPIYNPVTPDAWKNHVNYFINAIENTPPYIYEVLNIPLNI